MFIPHCSWWSVDLTVYAVVVLCDIPLKWLNFWRKLFTLFLAPQLWLILNGNMLILTRLFITFLYWWMPLAWLAAINIMRCILLCLYFKKKFVDVFCLLLKASKICGNKQFKTVLFLKYKHNRMHNIKLKIVHHYFVTLCTVVIDIVVPHWCAATKQLRKTRVVNVWLLYTLVYLKYECTYTQVLSYMCHLFYIVS